MHWQLTPYILPLLAAAAISAPQAVYAWRRRSMPGATAFALLMAAVLVWALSYTLELAVAGLPAKLAWARVTYLCTALLPLLWLLFAVQYGGPEQRVSRRLWLVLPIEPFLTALLVLTNDVHHLVWTHVALDTSGPFPLLHLEHGSWLWLHSAYASLSSFA